MSVVKEGWTYKKLGNICDILNGYAFKGNTYVANGIRVIRISNVQKGIVEDKDPKFFPLSSKKVIENYLLNEGDLLISLTGNVGRVGLLCRELLPAALNQRVACLRLIDINIDKRYLYHFLNSEYFENICINNSKGVAQLNLSTVWLSNFAIPVPPIPIQQSIVSEFDKINELIALKKSQLKDLDALAQSIFYEMFGDPVENEKGWNTKALETFTKTCGGGTPSKSKSEYWNGNIPWVTSKDMKTTYIFDSLIHITEDGVNNSAAKILPKDTILLVNRSGILKHSLPVAITTREVTINQDLKALSIDKKIAVPIFILYCIKGSSHHLLGKVKAVTVDSINFSEFKLLQIPLPPISLQHQFAERVESIERMKQQVQTAIKDLETLLASRMQYWFD